jgi:hypothetical protein
MEIKPNDRRIMDLLRAEIDHPDTTPDTTPERRAEAREDLGGVAMGYLDVLTDEEKRELAETGRLAPDPNHKPLPPYSDDDWRVIE